jgi:hypothetical protein
MDRAKKKLAWSQGWRNAERTSNHREVRGRHSQTASLFGGFERVLKFGETFLSEQGLNPGNTKLKLRGLSYVGKERFLESCQHG